MRILITAAASLLDSGGSERLPGICPRGFYALLTAAARRGKR